MIGVCGISVPRESDTAEVPRSIAGVLRSPAPWKLLQVRWCLDMAAVITRHLGGSSAR